MSRVNKVRESTWSKTNRKKMKHMASDSTQKNGFIYQGEFVSEVCALLHEFYSSKPWVQFSSVIVF